MGPKDFVKAVENRLSLLSYAMGNGPTTEQVVISTLRELAIEVDRGLVLIRASDLLSLADALEREVNAGP